MFERRVRRLERMIPLRDMIATGFAKQHKYSLFEPEKSIRAIGLFILRSESKT